MHLGNENEGYICVWDAKWGKSTAGFVIEEVCEPVPEDWAVKKLPTIVKEYIKPNFLIVKARKI